LLKQPVDNIFRNYLLIEGIFLGTLLNSQSKISERTAASLKEALARGVKVIIATGKVRSSLNMP
jgi:hypothetical protein